LFSFLNFHIVKIQKIIGKLSKKQYYIINIQMFISYFALQSSQTGITALIPIPLK